MTTKHKNVEGAGIPGWMITVSPCRQYLYVTRDGAPGMVQIKAEDEGFVVDLLCDDATQESVATCCATWAELEPE